MNRINVQDLKYHYITFGSESIINSTKDGIFKRFLPSLNLEVKKNKEKKLILLDKIDELKKYYANINSLIYSINNDFLAGYIVKICEGLPLNEIFLLPEQKINALKQLKIILNDFENYGIIYEDIHFDNIFYDEKTNKLKLIDIDNIKIDNFSIDTISFLTKYYFNNGGKDEKKSRIYNFNLISYMLLYNCTSDYNFDYLIKNKNNVFYNKEVDNLVENLLSTKIDTLCDNEYLIDMIDEKVLIK